MSNTKVLILWGMHRSGTSLLTSWLHACGLNVGRELLGGGPGNERGHYEDMDFLRLHERILHANGLHTSGLLNAAPLQIPPALLQEIRELVAHKCKSPQWGWKEPRTCLFTREYLELLPQARHLIVYRDYALVADSLVRRTLKSHARRIRKKKSGLKRAWFSLKVSLWQRFMLPKLPNRYLADWVRYNENLLALVDAVDPASVVVMDCRNFVASSRRTLMRLQQWGFELEHRPAENLVDSSMMANAPTQDFAFDPALRARADEITRRLAALAVSTPSELRPASSEAARHRI